MNPIFQSFEDKLYKGGLADKDIPLFGISDYTGKLSAPVLWNREKKESQILEKIFEPLNIKALLFSQPAEPYRTIINYLAENSEGKITPQDCETRHFLHDLPVLSDFDADALIQVLQSRKCVIFPGYGILTCSEYDIEKSYVTFSSVCFACFVKFFSDFLYNAKRGNLTQKQINIFNQVVNFPEFSKCGISGECKALLQQAPFESESDVLSAIEEAGRLTVEYRLVDSCFGNISYYHDDILYISQTGSFLDNLNGHIVSCSLNEDLPCKGASSELPAHRRIIKETGSKAILHGHPMFSVILSMDCDDDNCKNRGACHLKCSKERFACNIPVVPGEVGGGEYGLCNTVPDAIKERDGVIVLGHGVFTTGKKDFNEPFQHLLQIEASCRREYFNRVEKA